MPRKAKEESNTLSKNENIIEKNEIEKKSNISPKATTSKKKTSAKTKASVDSKNLKKTTASSKTATKSNANSKTTENSTVNQKTAKKTTRSKSTKKSTSKTTSAKRTKSPAVSPIISEYYDLPFRYNETVVKVLAQTPNVLFIYWDISDTDKQNYIEKYGVNFFNHTKPYLIITNETMNYTFEVGINDFANSWYLHINDANCAYHIELGRKFIVNSNHEASKAKSDNANNSLVNYHVNDYIYITSSNKMDAPNDHILFDKLGNHVFFKNIKSNMTEEKNISSLSFMHKINKVYNIYDLYKEIYQDELNLEDFGITFAASNSSSKFK